MDFKSEQLKYSRVRQAYRENEDAVKALLKQQSISPENLEIFLRIFKRPGIIELWGRNKENKTFTRLKEYKFCATSGDLGPKRKQGDYQIPEGFYFIDRFNPTSNFYLSLGINYPNQSDLILGDSQNPGGDIFIHGNCVTIGCIPITDPLIRELYVFAVEAKNHGQDKISVHIFPDLLDDGNFERLCAEYAGDRNLEGFWSNLKESYDYFKSNRSIPSVEISAEGRYIFN
ncbi:MAG TPA: L,D-transpeptidase family protein [Cyclobacteriaceae bacterium]|nr:L,D-transpeptidase family protein [Cyclobacteriaceae bacterium]